MSAGGWLIPKLVDFAEANFGGYPFLSPEENTIPMLMVGLGFLGLSVAVFALLRKPAPPIDGPAKHR